MIGKFADPHEDLMPWAEMTDSVHHANDVSASGNEKVEESASLLPISRRLDQY